MGKAIKYFKEWNDWRKRNMNGKFYKFLVLIRIAKSPTFEIIRNINELKKLEKKFKDL